MPRRYLITARVLALLLATALPCRVAAAQRGGAAPPFDGPRGAYSFELSDGEPVSFYLEWARLLELSEPQKTGLIEIRRRLRLQNAPYMRQLDSLRQFAGVDMATRGRLTERDQEALKRFQEWSAPVIDSIRLNNDGARRVIRALLDAGQMSRADSLNTANRDRRVRRAGERPPGSPNERSRARW